MEEPELALRNLAVTCKHHSKRQASGHIAQRTAQFRALESRHTDRERHRRITQEGLYPLLFIDCQS